jgi:hypothetical protein
MSYLQQQKKVEAENEKIKRRKIDDELEIQNEEARISLEAHELLNTDNEQKVIQSTIPVLDETQQISEGNQNDNNTTITVKIKYLFYSFFFKSILKLYQSKPHIVCSPSTEVLPDRTLVKLLQTYCCEWNCNSVIFKKLQVHFMKYLILTMYLTFNRLLLLLLYWMHLLIYLLRYVLY